MLFSSAKLNSGCSVRSQRSGKSLWQRRLLSGNPTTYRLTLLLSNKPITELSKIGLQPKILRQVIRRNPPIRPHGRPYDHYIALMVQSMFSISWGSSIIFHYCLVVLPILYLVPDIVVLDTQSISTDIHISFLISLRRFIHLKLVPYVHSAGQFPSVMH